MTDNCNTCFSRSPCKSEQHILRVFPVSVFSGPNHWGSKAVLGLGKDLRCHLGMSFQLSWPADFERDHKCPPGAFSSMHTGSCTAGDDCGRCSDTSGRRAASSGGMKWRELPHRHHHCPMRAEAEGNRSPFIPDNP